MKVICLCWKRFQSLYKTFFPKIFPKMFHLISKGGGDNVIGGVSLLLRLIKALRVVRSPKIRRIWCILKHNSGPPNLWVTWKTMKQLDC